MDHIPILTTALLVSEMHLWNRTASFVNTVDSRYRYIKDIVAKAKNALITFFETFEQEEIAGVRVNKSHKILGVWIDSRRWFNGNSAQVLIRWRRAMTWIHSFRQLFSFKHRKQAYNSFVESLMENRFLPTWARMTQKAQLQWSRVKYAAVRTILGASTTVLGSIACREAGILPRSQRSRLVFF